MQERYPKEPKNIFYEGSLMDETQKRKVRLEQLLNQQKRRNNSDYSVLFNECIHAMERGIFLYSDQETRNIYNKFQQQYPILLYGRIDWDNVDHSEVTLEEVKERFQDQQLEECYVLWSHGDDPVIKAKVIGVLKNFDNVSAVSPDVWLFKENKYVIEFFHDGIYRIGYYNKT